MEGEALEGGPKSRCRATWAPTNTHSSPDQHEGLDSVISSAWWEREPKCTTVRRPHGSGSVFTSTSPVHTLCSRRLGPHHVSAAQFCTLSTAHTWPSPTLCMGRRHWADSGVRRCYGYLHGRQSSPTPGLVTTFATSVDYSQMLFKLLAMYFHTDGRCIYLLMKKFYILTWSLSSFYVNEFISYNLDTKPSYVFLFPHSVFLLFVFH